VSSPAPQRTRSAALVSTFLGDPMTRCFRISKGPSVGDILDSIESLEAFARQHGPGRYNVDEHSLDLFPGTKVSAGAGGKLIHHKDGQVLLDLITWSTS
jgi:hypothetical protein